MANKINKELHETHAKRLSAIIDAHSTFAGHLTRHEFATVLKVELNTLAEIEKKFSKEKLSEKLTSEFLTKEFISLTKIEFKLGENFKYDDEDDLIDNINYLPTYCKNIFKVNIDDVVEGKKVVAENPNINLGPKHDSDEPNMDAAAAFNMGAMGYAGSPYENPYIMGKAYSMLNKDIAEGKVYQYKSKPKAIVIVKWFLAILLGLSIIALIGTSIFCFMTNGLKVHVNGLESDTSLSTITNGVFYLICSGFGIYVLYTTIKTMLKKNKKVNENALYSFNWYFYLAFIILSLLMTLLDLRTTWFYSGRFTILETTGSHVNGFRGWKYGILFSSSIIGSCLIPMIIGAVMAPKQDRSKIEALLKQYIDDAVKSSPFQPMGGQPGAEVQTPVEVKPAEEKPGLKKSDNKSETDEKKEPKSDSKNKK